MSDWRSAACAEERRKLRATHFSAELSLLLVVVLMRVALAVFFLCLTRLQPFNIYHWSRHEVCIEPFRYGPSELDWFVSRASDSDILKVISHCNDDE